MNLFLSYIIIVFLMLQFFTIVIKKKIDIFILTIPLENDRAQ